MTARLAFLGVLLASGCAREPVLPVVPGAHADPTAMTASPDGRTLYVVCPAQRAIATIEVRGRELSGLHAFSSAPRGVAVSRDGASLAVSFPGDGRVEILDARSFAVRATARVGVEPAGMAFSCDGLRLFVANARSSDVSVVDVVSGAEVRRVAAGREPWVVVLSPDGATVAVVSRSANVGAPDRIPESEITLLDSTSGGVVRRVMLPSCHLAESAAFTTNGRRLLVPLVRVRNLLPIVQVDRGWVMSTVLASIDVATGGVALLPLNGTSDSLPDPAGIAVTDDLAFVTSRGTDRVAALRLAGALALEKDAGANRPEHLSWSERYVTARFDVGAAPAAVVVAGTLLAGAERLGDSGALLEPDGRLAARVRIVPHVADDAARRGDRVFHDARFAFQSSFSCSSCHPDGHTDGLVYDFEIDGVGRNFVLNRSLRGVKGTGPFKWTGRNASLAEQCGPRFAKVLTRADPFPEQALADLVAFIESRPAPSADPRAVRLDGRQTAAVARGRAIFERTVRRSGVPIEPADRCVTCHPAPHYTNLRRAGVGTQSDNDDTGTFDVPHLTGVASKAPYLHDGRAPGLEEIWTAPGVGDLHGAVTDLTKTDLDDLVEFLKGL